MSRLRKRRSGRPVRESTADQGDPVWVDVGGRRMFVVGWTSGGAPYGVYEDEMEITMNGLDADGRDQPF